MPIGGGLDHCLGAPDGLDALAGLEALAGLDSPRDSLRI
jgi:hypothetical protein